MTTVEVLAPLRIETRFVAPGDRADGMDQWRLRLRVYPDDFSIQRRLAPGTGAELDRLSELIATLDDAAAFASFASSVGAARALWLWRHVVKDEGGGVRTVDRTHETAHVPFSTHGPAGLPPQLEVWLVEPGGGRSLGATLNLLRDEIAADLDLAVFDDTPRLAAGELPKTWWLSYERAVQVGLGIDLDVGIDVPQFEAIVVVGIGDRDPAELIGTHNAGSRIAVLTPGTPTNTVAGEPTTDLGQDAASLFALLPVEAEDQLSTRAVLTALTGTVSSDALPLLNGDLDYYGPGSIAVQGLWPVLWGRALRDVTGAGDHEPDVARWAIHYLAVEGARPAIRVGEQPYGLLPTSTFASWLPFADEGATDDLAQVERRILDWALPWREGAAHAARAAGNRVHGAADEVLLDVLGLHAPNRHWRVRPVAERPSVAALRAMRALPPLAPDEWDRATASAWRDWSYPFYPIAPAARTGRVPGAPNDEVDTPEMLERIARMEPEQLYRGWEGDTGLVGHLCREAMICARAIIGEAHEGWAAGRPIELGRPLPLNDEDTYLRYVEAGNALAIDELRQSGDDNANQLLDRFDRVQEGVIALGGLWGWMGPQLFNGVLAALDTAAGRVDPWLTGVAERRLRRMTGDGAPFRLGAYGWVDAPAPYLGPPQRPPVHGPLDAPAPAPDLRLAPGPTAAGLLHAPSHAQALTAALLRDAAVRYPGDDRWKLTIDSAKVRAAVALAERVRLGVHPYEALGLEVEKIAGDWEVVRALRKQYPLAGGQQERRVCDGAKVLAAARTGTLAPGLPADLAAALEPLDDVLDTYADLLVTDGIHALVTGRADLANAAMEAAAGFGAPSELRAMRTPHSATTVRVSAWALLESGALTANPLPVEVADPAFVAMIAVADATAADRLAMVIGGAQDEPPVPSLSGGTYEGLGAGADDALRAAMAADLVTRLDRLRTMAQADHDVAAALDEFDPETAHTVSALATRWGIDLSRITWADPAIPEVTPAQLRDAFVATVADRLTAGSAVGATVNLLRKGIRSLVGHPQLPVLPVVDRSLLPVLRPSADLDRTWLEVVAAVRTRLAPLEAHQLDPTDEHWPAAIAAPDGSNDPWHAGGPIVIAYGPGVASGSAHVAIAAIDAWTDSIPSNRHATTATFGFNAPKSRAPQAILLAVPPDPAQRLDNGGLLDVVLETRELAHARAARPTDWGGLPYATPMPLVHAVAPPGFLTWWQK